MGVAKPHYFRSFNITPKSINSKIVIQRHVLSRALGQHRQASRGSKTAFGRDLITQRDPWVVRYTMATLQIPFFAYQNVFLQHFFLPVYPIIISAIMKKAVTTIRVTSRQSPPPPLSFRRESNIYEGS